MQVQFGSGLLWGIPLTDAAGAAITTPTPVLFGALQDVSVDFNFDVKELHGQYQFPLDVARGKGKIGGKSAFAQLNGAMVNSLFFGQTLNTGITGVKFDTAGSAIPATPFQITVTPPDSGVFLEDLGVRNSNGLAMTRVASAPAEGQYSVASGVYTFAAADTGKTVYISYSYTATVAGSKKISVQNQILGNVPTFKATFSMPYKGKQATIILPACTSTKLGFATKLDDYLMPNFEFSAYADATGKVVDMAFNE